MIYIEHTSLCDMNSNLYTIIPLFMTVADPEGTQQAHAPSKFRSTMFFFVSVLYQNSSKEASDSMKESI